MNISPEVVILTKSELDQKLQAEFSRGVTRGKFEADCVRTEAAIKETLRMAAHELHWKLANNSSAQRIVNRIELVLGERVL